MPRVCLQFVIVIFPDHTKLLFLRWYDWVNRAINSLSRVGVGTSIMNHNLPVKSGQAIVLYAALYNLSFYCLIQLIQLSCTFMYPEAH